MSLIAATCIGKDVLGGLCEIIQVPGIGFLFVLLHCELEIHELRVVLVACLVKQCHLFKLTTVLFVFGVWQLLRKSKRLTLRMVDVLDELIRANKLPMRGR